MKDWEPKISVLNASTTSAGNFIMVLQELNSSGRIPAKHRPVGRK